MGNKTISILINTMLVIFFSAFLISGCSSGYFSNTTSGTAAANADSGSSTESSQPKAVYYDFDDILCPTELALVEKSTFIVTSNGYTSGILTLRGRIEKNSLVNFYTVNMLKDNWNSVSQIKSPVSSILVFQKSSRWAVITMREKEFYTYVEVGVAPTLSQTIPAIESGGESTLFE